MRLPPTSFCVSARCFLPVAPGTKPSLSLYSPSPDLLTRPLLCLRSPCVIVFLCIFSPWANFYPEAPFSHTLSNSLPRWTLTCSIMLYCVFSTALCSHCLDSVRERHFRGQPPSRVAQEGCHLLKNPLPPAFVSVCEGFFHWTGDHNSFTRMYFAKVLFSWKLERCCSASPKILSWAEWRLSPLMSIPYSWALGQPHPAGSVAWIFIIIGRKSCHGFDSSHWVVFSPFLAHFLHFVWRMVLDSILNLGILLASTFYLISYF